MQKENKKKNNKACPMKLKRSGGFVILFAFMLSSMLLAIALGITNIALKEIKFSTSAKDTNDAFFTADVGAECALYNDKSDSIVFSETSNMFITCNNNNFFLSGGYPKFDFNISGLGPNAQGCAKVSVDKAGTCGSATCIVSKGYNDGGNVDNQCNPTQNAVERQLELSY